MKLGSIVLINTGENSQHNRTYKLTKLHLNIVKANLGPEEVFRVY